MPGIFLHKYRVLGAGKRTRVKCRYSHLLMSNLKEIECHKCCVHFLKNPVNFFRCRVLAASNLDISPVFEPMGAFWADNPVVV